MGNVIEIEGDVAMLILSGGERARIDLADLPRVSAFTWGRFRQPTGDCYATSRIEGRTVYMHRLIMGVTDRRVQVDHIDHDGLNNRRSNLRVVSNQQNHENLRGPHKQGTTGVRGLTVQVDKAGRRRYKARVMVDYRIVAQRYFDYSEAGREEARQWLLAERAQRMPHADARAQSGSAAVTPPPDVAPKAYRKGSAHGMAKVTEQQVREMRRLHNEGVTNAALERRFGLSSGSVSRIVNRIDWGWLEEEPS